MKKILSIILLLMLLVTILTACGGKNKCGACNGSGYYQKKTCPICNGSGYSDFDPYERYKNIMS